MRGAWTNTQSRVVGAKAIGRSLSVSPATIYSWSKRHNSPVPLYRTPDCRLWCKAQDVEEYWGRSEMVCGADDGMERAAREAVRRALGTNSEDETEHA